MHQVPKVDRHVDSFRESKYRSFEIKKNKLSENTIKYIFKLYIIVNIYKIYKSFISLYAYISYKLSYIH